MKDTQAMTQAPRAHMPAEPVPMPVDSEAIYLPDVDISEGADAFRLVADMPGADAASVSATVTNNVLTLEGTAKAEPPADCQLAGQEYALGKYRRDFALSGSVDPSRIKARVRNGVLEVTLPKRETARTKTIPIET